MQHFLSNNSNIKSKSLTSKEYTPNVKSVLEIQQLEFSDIRKEADFNLSQLGRFMRDVSTSAGETNFYQEFIHEKKLLHVRISNWGFFHEEKIAGSSLIDYIPKYLQMYPEIEGISRWLYIHITPFLNTPFDIERILNLHSIPESKFPKVQYNSEAYEDFSYKVKAIPSTIILKAYPFILDKFPALKLYFIIEENLLIDFFFWHVSPLLLAEEQAASSSSS